MFFLASVTPFRVRVNFDENEHPPNAIAATDDTAYNDGECLLRPGGIVGKFFCLDCITVI